MCLKQVAVRAFNEVLHGSFYAAMAAYLTLGIMSFLSGWLFSGLIIGIAIAPFVFLSAIPIGIFLKIIEVNFKASVQFWFCIYVLIALVLTPVVQILVFGNNPFFKESWHFEIFITYLPIGLGAAVGAWYGAVYKIA